MLQTQGPLLLVQLWCCESDGSERRPPVECDSLNQDDAVETVVPLWAQQSLIQHCFCQPESNFLHFLFPVTGH